MRLRNRRGSCAVGCAVLLIAFVVLGRLIPTRDSTLRTCSPSSPRPASVVRSVQRTCCAVRLGLNPIVRRWTLVLSQRKDPANREFDPGAEGLLSGLRARFALARAVTRLSFPAHHT